MNQLNCDAGEDQINQSIRRQIDDFTLFLTKACLPVDEAFNTEFHHRLAEIDRATLGHDKRKDWMEYLFSQVGSELDQSVVHKQGRHKPFGYSGDFQIIDYTYQRYNASPGRGKIWDDFYHRQDAPLAVCDRKDRFGRELCEIASHNPKRPLRILNVASGPGREIRDGMAASQLSPNDVSVVCVEIDPAAVKYSRLLLGPEMDASIAYHIGNVTHFRPESEFDFVWSAGLFDYLNDQVATRVLSNLWKGVAPGGRLIVGNFAETHRTRPYIEWCGAWFLIHRTEQDLFHLADVAGIPSSSCHQEIDHLGAIRFLIAER